MKGTAAPPSPEFGEGGLPNRSGYGAKIHDVRLRTIAFRRLSGRQRIAASGLDESRLREFLSLSPSELTCGRILTWRSQNQKMYPISRQFQKDKAKQIRNPKYPKREALGRLGRGGQSADAVCQRLSPKPSEDSGRPVLDFEHLDLFRISSFLLRILQPVRTRHSTSTPPRGADRISMMPLMRLAR